MIEKVRGRWKIRMNGKVYKFHSEQEAKDFLGQGTDWKPWTPPDLPLPEVREYESMEEAVEAEDVGVSLLED